ncbi:hypothetical protein [Caballeronia sp.]|uniref:hypothetical protein n=1 Tax=Caballeronia sp. TaxID=1931223 RepID=UPI0026395A1B|nr:hypothetical protein [Caballeronia sp.]
MLPDPVPPLLPLPDPDPFEPPADAPDVPPPLLPDPVPPPAAPPDEPPDAPLPVPLPWLPDPVPLPEVPFDELLPCPSAAMPVLDPADATAKPDSSELDVSDSMPYPSFTGPQLPAINLWWLS